MIAVSVCMESCALHVVCLPYDVNLDMQVGVVSHATQPLSLPSINAGVMRVRSATPVRHHSICPLCIWIWRVPVVLSALFGCTLLHLHVCVHDVHLFLQASPTRSTSPANAAVVSLIICAASCLQLANECAREHACGQSPIAHCIQSVW